MLQVLAAILLAVTGCSRASSEPDMPEDEGTVTLDMRINLRAAAKGDIPDDLMHTLRIIILDANGYAEHNAYWNFGSALEEFTTSSFKVKANETKTILMVANEESAVLTFPDGSKADAHAWLEGIDAAAGEYVDMATVRGITMTLADNFADDGSMKNGNHYIPMSAVHTYTVGDNQNYSGTFYIHRSAAKYTFRFKIDDDIRPHYVNSVGISTVASTEYFFPNATFAEGTAIPQATLVSYAAPAGLAANDLTFAVNGTIPVGTKDYVEFGPYYVPEGQSGSEYSVSFTLNGKTFPWQTLKPTQIDGTPVQSPQAMTDLPRNTHIIVNVSLKTYKVTYTVCPWNLSTIDIPEFE